MEDEVFDVMPGFVHRPTDLPGADPDNDRTCFLDGVAIARVYLVGEGGHKGRWRWSGLWNVPPNRSAAGGHVETLSDALKAIKRELPRHVS